MGTTFTGAYSTGRDMFTLHVGDSRAYLFHKGSLQQLTRDQTLAQALADAGEISPREVQGHYLSHTLTSCLGGQNGRVDLEIRHWHLDDGDRVLLCSDGLTEMVPAADIADIMQKNEGSQKACQALLDAAMEKGGKDNITVLLARYQF